MTEVQVRKRLVSEVERAGGVRPLAREWEISPTVISMTVNGRRRPGPAVLSRLRIEVTTNVTRRVIYSVAK